MVILIWQVEGGVHKKVFFKRYYKDRHLVVYYAEGYGETFLPMKTASDRGTGGGRVYGTNAEHGSGISNR